LAQAKSVVEHAVQAVAEWLERFKALQADLDEARRAETDALAASSGKTGARTNRTIKEQLK